MSVTRSLDGDVGPRPDGDPESRRHERRRVVDAIPDHGHAVTAGSEGRDGRDLALRQDVGRDVVGGQPQPPAHGERGRASIAREHPDRESLLAEEADRLGRLGADGVGDGDAPSRRPSDASHVDRRAVGREAVRLGAQVVGHIEGCRPQAADRHRPPVDGAPHALAGDRLERLSRPTAQAAVGRRLDHRGAQRMLARPLQRCRQVEDVVLRHAIGRQDRRHGGPAQREGAGLVEHDGVDAPGRLERLAAAHEDARLGAAARRDHDRRRRGQAHRARARDDHDPDERGERERQPWLGPERQPHEERRHGRDEDSRHEPLARIRSARRWSGDLLPWARRTR